MAELLIDWVVVSDCATNCYICRNSETNAGFIVDPGDNAARIIAKTDQLGVKPEKIILTHSHYDHIGAAEEVAKHYGIQIFIGEKEAAFLHDPVSNLSASFTDTAVTLNADVTLSDGEEVELAGFTAKVILTPGHTPGGICLYFEDQKTLISGDTLFCESLGRTDFPGGNTRQIVTSIINKLFVLPDDTKVYPGHMGETTIEHEKKYNPCAGFVGRV